MNFFLDKKGVIARILSTIPTFLIIVLIMGFFLVVVGFFSLLRGANVPAFIEGVDVGSYGDYGADVLFDVVEIEQERAMLLDVLIRDSLYREEEKYLYEKIKIGGFNNAEEESAAKEKIHDISRYGINLREGIKRLLEIKREGCFIVFFEKGKPVLSNLQSSRDIYFVVSNSKIANGNVEELEAYYDAGLLKGVSLDINSVLNDEKNFKFYMQYYFGKCYSYNELQKLIKDRRENG